MSNTPSNVCAVRGSVSLFSARQCLDAQTFDAFLRGALDRWRKILLGCGWRTVVYPLRLSALCGNLTSSPATLPVDTVSTTGWPTKQKVCVHSLPLSLANPFASAPLIVACESSSVRFSLYQRLAEFLLVPQ